MLPFSMMAVTVLNDKPHDFALVELNHWVMGPQSLSVDTYKCKFVACGV